MMSSDVSLLFLWEVFYLLMYLAVFIFLGWELRFHAALPGLAAGGLLIYLCSVGFTVLLYQYFGFDAMLLFVIQVCYALGLAVWMGRWIWRSRHELSFGALMLLALDLAAVLFITLFSRLGDPSRGGLQLMPFRDIMQAAQNSSTFLLQHAFLNVLLFVPTGILLYHLGLERLRRVEINFLVGLVLSTAIETIQLVAHLGLCDINDIICNALGAALGAALCRFIFCQERGEHSD